jgi:glycosyltransferase involved in cell wall biosynthesis
VIRRNRWIVLHEAGRLRWGGDLRRHYIFRGLADRARTTFVDGWSPDVIDAALSQDPRGRRALLLASVEMLGREALKIVTTRTRCAALDVHDHAVLQFDAFGLHLDPARRAGLAKVHEANLDAFGVHVAQSETFARLAGLDPARTIVAPNGTDTDIVRPAPWPASPRIAMASGAAPGRGIERLIEATALIRERHRDVRLDLWLVATGPGSVDYLEGLRATAAAHAWVTIGSLTYEKLGETIGRATVTCVPHPRNEYMDAVIPVKLADAMAAGRPVVVTPCVEMRRIVERTGAGVVASDDTTEALAAALDRVITDEALARRCGAAARRAAEREFDWRVIGARLARALTRRFWW